ncbi:MAG: alkaline phosphatase [Saprospiraceae bacterium]
MILAFFISWWLFFTKEFLPTPPPEKPTNIIFVIGDGMGLAHIALGELLAKPPSALQKMEVVGLQKTHSASHLETDSGAAATAMACGVKTFNAAEGVGPDSIAVTSIMELAKAHGLKTGFVVTCPVVHATPAAFYSHVDSRGSYEDIARQLAHFGMDVFIGGGEKYFTERSTDHSNLIEDLQRQNYEILTSEDPSVEFNLARISKSKKIAGFTAYEDPVRASEGRTYLPDMVSEVMDAMKARSDKGYFLLVEASQIDWAAHANDQEWLALEMQDTYSMLDVILRKIDSNTLLVVTADHECGYISIRGKYAPRVDFGSKVHSSQMVPVFAHGPGAEEFAGIYENTEIFQKMKMLLGL